MKIAFDLDGTLYDTFPIVFNVENSIRRDLGYSDISREEYLDKFQTKDWRKLCLDFGIRNEDVDEVIKGFHEVYTGADLPYLVPGAKETLFEIADKIGEDNIYIVTNNVMTRIESMLNKDGLAWLLSNVRNPKNCKSDTLYDIATSNCGGLAVYVGDIVSDGEACRDAIKRGADNLKFYGMLHGYAMHSSDNMIKFIMDNRIFARGVTDIRDIGKVID